MPVKPYEVSKIICAHFTHGENEVQGAKYLPKDAQLASGPVRALSEQCGSTA